MTKKVKRDCTTCRFAVLEKTVGDKEVSFFKYDKKRAPCNGCMFVKVRNEWEPMEKIDGFE